jgi:hypothetical protein
MIMVSFHAQATPKDFLNPLKELLLTVEHENRGSIERSSQSLTRLIMSYSLALSRPLSGILRAVLDSQAF